MRAHYRRRSPGHVAKNTASLALSHRADDTDSPPRALATRPTKTTIESWAEGPPPTNAHTWRRKATATMATTQTWAKAPVDKLATRQNNGTNSSEGSRQGAYANRATRSLSLWVDRVVSIVGLLHVSCTHRTTVASHPSTRTPTARVTGCRTCRPRVPVCRAGRCVLPSRAAGQ